MRLATPAFCRPSTLAPLTLGIVLVMLIPSSAQPQPSILNGPWSGQAQCTLTVEGLGYLDSELHTWTLSGAPPKVQGTMHIFPATWSAKGQGSYSRSQGGQDYQAQWAMNVSRSDAPIAIFIRASDGKMVINTWHAQLRQAGAVQGTQTTTLYGVPQAPGLIDLEAFEWQFPAAGATVDASGNSFTGTKTDAIDGQIGPMQPGGLHATQRCSWQIVAVAAAPASATSSPKPAATSSPSPAPSTAALPAVSTGAATSVSSTSAIVSGSANPNGSNTHFAFVYGTFATTSPALTSTRPKRPTM